MPGVREFSPKQPLPLAFDTARIPWADHHSADVTAGAPQQLHRHVIDALGKFGYYLVYHAEPAIQGQAIGDTGVTQGYVLAEKNLHSVHDPYNAYRLAGLVVLLSSMVWIVAALYALTQGDFALLVLFLIVFGVFVAIGAALLRLHAFDSRLIYVTVRGEVYRAGLDSHVQKLSQGSGSQRLSILSELRVTVSIAGVRTRNDGNQRVAIAPTIVPELRGEFQAVVNEMAATALPKAVLQKSVDQVRHEILVRCGYCSTVSGQSTTVCPGCGAPLTLNEEPRRDEWRAHSG